MVKRAAKRAIFSMLSFYAKHPTPQHTERVEDARKEVRRMESLSDWRAWRARTKARTRPGECEGVAASDRPSQE